MNEEVISLSECPSYILGYRCFYNIFALYHSSPYGNPSTSSGLRRILLPIDASQEPGCGNFAGKASGELPKQRTVLRMKGCSCIPGAALTLEAVKCLVEATRDCSSTVSSKDVCLE